MSLDLTVCREKGAWVARFGETVYRCALGPGGCRRDKREGDGATPIGSWPMRRVLYRPDRMAAPPTALPVAALDPADGWCDDPEDAHYNRPVTLPYEASHEVLWREDEIYDVIVILGHNDDPPVPGAGSAIFLHVARPDYSPTQGCVALAREDLLAVLGAAGPGTAVVVED
ncbi:MAG: L,D-transpeptidase family protein [Kiloniellales bacterium]|nr:L,D-transpeptidase family protein [Kiloniellales bacterium]